jgi:hypothetical protein
MLTGKIHRHDVLLRLRSLGPVDWECSEGRAMSKRRLLICTFGVVPAGLTFWLVVWWFVPTEPAEVRAYERLQLGMTTEKVQAIIGLPPGDYGPESGLRKSPSSGPFGQEVKSKGLPSANLHGPGGFPKYTVERWLWKDYWIWIAFDERGQAVGIYLIEVMDESYPRTKPSFLDRLRTWLGV